MRSIGVVTGSRADYGLYVPLLRRIADDPSLELLLYATGTHLSPEFHETVTDIERDGFQVAERVDATLACDRPSGVAKAMGLGTIGFAQVFSRRRPDLLVVLGDRFEMHAAALAALPFTIPLAHIHGGELTLGAFDDALRHSLTKLSHLHFTATDEYARRVVQLGEERWRVSVSGALGLDNVAQIQLMSVKELEDLIGLSLEPPPLLVTFHPTTLEYESAVWQTQQLCAALGSVGRPLVFTAPNADTAGRAIRKELETFVGRDPRSRLVENLGTRGYFSVMAIAGAMVGNSSSGIIEAMTFHLPVVNVGRRQEGRLKDVNVIDVGYRTAEIQHGIEQALAADMKTRLAGRTNRYGDGRAAERILSKLKDVPLDKSLLKKTFLDLPLSQLMDVH
ncbi:MAG TPA: UDP-N-acetylglucosamine 2-epimerase [Nitrospiraceae bacterium]|nr:UDP-N-acetylglucosamine 2-epimerase [Nitrospiraceae bacterium]